MGVFIFPPHLFNAATLSWETAATLVSVNTKNIKIMKISQEDAILIFNKNLYLSRDVMHEAV